MHLRKAIGQEVLRRVLRQPDKYPRAVIEEAESAQYVLRCREQAGNDDTWPQESSSWDELKDTFARHGIDLPALLDCTEPDK